MADTDTDIGTDIAEEPAGADAAGAARAGRRARNKADKLRRIKDAAWELFRERGFDGTTTREIARRAGVALGTLFTYASDKRDLLFLVFNDQQDELRREAFAAIPGDAPFLDQLMALFAPFYARFAREPGFTRDLLRELTFYTEGIQAPRFQEGRQSIVARVRDLVEDALADGRLATPAAPATVAGMIFGLYQAELRRWLADAPGGAPDSAAGLARLRDVLAILIDGLGGAGESLTEK